MAEFRLNQGSGTTVSDDDPMPVTASGAGYTSSVTLTRTADTTPLTANDVMGASTAAGSAVLEFASIAPTGGDDMLITSIDHRIDRNAVISGETTYVLHLFSATPPSALADNAPHTLPSGDRSVYLGNVNIGGPVDQGDTCYSQINSVLKHVKLTGTSLFAYLVTVGAYTPASATVHTITIHATRV